MQMNTITGTQVNVHIHVNVMTGVFKSLDWKQIESTSINIAEQSSWCKVTENARGLGHFSSFYINTLDDP